MGIDELRAYWRKDTGREPPVGFSRDGLARALAYRFQEQRLGGLPARVAAALQAAAKGGATPTRWLKVGTVLTREHGGDLHTVTIVPGGFHWRGETHASLSAVARAITGTVWSGARFFGIKGEVRPASEASPVGAASAKPASAVTSLGQNHAMTSDAARHALPGPTPPLQRLTYKASSLATLAVDDNGPRAASGPTEGPGANTRATAP